MVLSSHPAEYWIEKLNKLNAPSVINNELAFKAQLGIGEEAYRELRIRNRLSDLWEIVGASGTGAALISSSVIANTFFAPTGILALVGLGTAVTPVGWIVGAAIVSGAGWHLIRKKYISRTSGKVVVIPDFINTPVDVLALSLLDLMMPLVLKIAKIDGHLEKSEESRIKGYFTEEWGYYPEIIDIVLPLWEENLKDTKIQEQIKIFVDYLEKNKDCNLLTIGKDFIDFIFELSEVDGIVHENETLAIEEVERTIKRYSSRGYF